jgi:hypothetical protein
LTASLLALLFGAPLLAAAPQEPAAHVLSILSERSGASAAYRFVLTGAPTSYSAAPEGDDIVIRIGAERRDGVPLPLILDPVESAEFLPGPGFVLRLHLRPAARIAPELVRDTGSLLLILRARPADIRATDPTPTPAPAQTPAEAPASPSPEPDRERATADSAQPSADDLYRILFPAAPGGGAPPPGLSSTTQPLDEDWYSDFRFLGLQLKPWISASWVDGETRVGNQPATRDTHFVVQPNLGLGFSPEFGPGGGRWRVNYTPRFREQVDVDIPELTSHFFDANIDQPVGASASVTLSYHHSRGVLDTQEVDPGREYGVGRQYVVDLALRPFRRNSIGASVRLELAGDLFWDVTATRTRVHYAPDESDRAALPFFGYESRALGTSVRRAFGAQSVSLGYSFSDTPAPEDRPEAESRAHGFQAGLDGEITPLLTGRLSLGYRAQKNPAAGDGGRSDRDLSYGAHLRREMSETAQVGVSADRRVNLSAYGGNAFYVADTARLDLSFRLPFEVSARAGVAAQRNGYRVEERGVDGSTARRSDRLVSWSVGLVRNVSRFAYLRADYFVERRNSNFDEFDVRSRALVLQIAIGAFGRPDAGSFGW